MTVEDKIKFAEYFFDKIKDDKNREDFLPNLGAFLSETRGIADYLLEDYNLKFGPGILLNDVLSKKPFKDKECDKMNLDALKFISTYNSKFKKLRQNKLANYLFKKRDTNVHKKSEQVQGNFSRGTTDSVTWKFKDYDNTDVVSLCEEFLKMMKNFVNDLKPDDGLL